MLLWGFLKAHGWSTSDVINFFVAAGTIWMAIATGISIKKSQQSINVARRAAEATEMSVERMKDSLMPYFDLSVERGLNSLYLTIRNVGSGLGTIRLSTIRTDIKYESVLNQIKYWGSNNKEKGSTKIQDFIIGNNEEYTFEYSLSQDFNINNNQVWVSSISIFYEDVYGRLYRSRIIYTLSASEDKLKIETIGKENFAIKQLPLNPTFISDIQKIRDFEGKSMVLYRGQSLPFYRYKFLNTIKNTMITGNEFTNNKDICLKDVEIEWNGYPVLLMQIDNKHRFKLSPLVLENQVTKFEVSDDKGNKDRRWQDFGLNPSGNDANQVRELYKHVLGSILNEEIQLTFI